MPRLARNRLDEEGFFHATAVGAGGCLIFEDELDRLSFADVFWDAVLRFELDCLVAAQVGTHYHALFKCARDSLSAAMRDLNGSYARRFNVRHGRRGHLFGDRFSVWVVEGERHLELTVQYILQNPVRAGLCSHPSEWEWSWLEPLRARGSWADLLPADPKDCPMGQALERARKRQERARLKRARAGNGKVARSELAASFVERDKL